jgi:hypothetical protein
MTLSLPSAWQASMSPSMPPKSAAEVAVAAAVPAVSESDDPQAVVNKRTALAMLESMAFL